MIFSPSTTSGPKVYRALMTQSGTDDPTVEILENTIGNVVWTRSTDGLYTGVLNIAFPVGRTFPKAGGCQGLSSALNQCLTIDGDSSTVEVRSYSIVDQFLRDGYLNRTPIEILVYPE